VHLYDVFEVMVLGGIQSLPDGLDEDGCPSSRMATFIDGVYPMLCFNGEVICADDPYPFVLLEWKERLFDAIAEAAFAEREGKKER
jgi:hypothetical protein